MVTERATLDTQRIQAKLGSLKEGETEGGVSLGSAAGRPSAVTGEAQWIDQQLAALRLVATYRDRQLHLHLTRRQIIRTWLQSMRKAKRRVRHASVRKRIAEWDRNVGYDADWKNTSGEEELWERSSE